jgi:predicted DNA-binding transcriptional regulator YafY
MANVKKQYKRYQIIDTLLRNPARRYTFKELHEAVAERLQAEEIYSGISERTIFIDLAQMQKDIPDGYGAPIDLDVNNCYFYTDPDFSITNCPLNKADADKLVDVLEVLKQFKDLPQFADLEEIILKLDHKSGLKGKSKKTVIEFEKTELKGLGHLNRIANAIRQNKNLNIKYQPYHKAETTFDISPQLLKEYNGRWFCFVLGLDKELFTIALDRIIAIENSKSSYSELAANELQITFKNIVGVTFPKNEKPVTVEFKANIKRSPYLETKPIHTSQTVFKRTKQYVVFRLHVIPNLELESIILSYGKDLEVLKPIDLREKIKAQLKSGFDLYC